MTAQQHRDFAEINKSLMALKVRCGGWMGSIWRFGGWAGMEDWGCLRWTNLYDALFRNACDDGLPHQIRQLGQECFRAQAQLLRQKATRVPYRSSSLTQAGTAARF